MAKQVSMMALKFGLLSAACLLAAQPSRAGLITALTDFDGKGVPKVKVSYKESPSATKYKTKQVYAGPSSTTIWDGEDLIVGPVESYCVDLLEDLKETRMSAVVEGVAGVVTSALGGGAYDRNIGAAGWLLENIAATDALSRGALQVAIWESIYDYDGTQDGLTNLNSGNFQLETTGDLFNLAAGYLDLVRNSVTDTYRTSQAVYVNYGAPNFSKHNQDQILPYNPGTLNAVPEPSSMAMAVIGVLALGAFRVHTWRRRVQR